MNCGNHKALCKKGNILIVTAVTILLVLAFALPVAADEAFTLYVSGSETGASDSAASIENLPIDAVSWWYDKGDGGYYLFLPSSADLDNLRFWFHGAADISIGGRVIANGAASDIFSVPGEYRVQAGGKTYRLTVMRSAKIGALFMTTKSGTMNHVHNSADHSLSEEGRMLLFNEKSEKEYDGALDQIKGRGNSTWKQPKKPYQIKLPAKSDLFGMGAHKTWVLLANHLDASLIRNALVFDLANGLGLPFSNQYTYVDVYANHHYLGNYMLTEKVQVGANRVEINDLEAATEKANSGKLENYPRAGSITGAVAGSQKWYQIPNDPADITGGYLLEFEFTYRYPNEASGFVTDRGQPIVIKGPEFASAAQVAYISGFVQDLEDAIYGENGYNKKGKHYSEYMDVNSAVLRYLIEEWTLNGDGGVSSFFLYKETDVAGDGLLHFGPSWDYDLAFGNKKGRTMTEAGDWLLNRRSIVSTSCPGWYAQLFVDPAFVGKVNEAYDASFKPLAEKILYEGVDKVLAQVDVSAAMNFVLWKNVYSPVYNVDIGTDPTVNRDYLRTFIEKRTALFDGGFSLQWNNPYVDIAEKSWYYGAVRDVTKEGLMIGTSATTFAPDATLNRAMVVTILSRLEKDVPEPSSASAFDDVPGGLWYSDAVHWAAANGIVQGTGAGKFSPLRSITREEMAVMLYHYGQYAGVGMDVQDQNALTAFTDAATVSPWAKEAMIWAVDKGIINGMGNGGLAPRGTATRAQAAALVMRSLAFMEAEPAI